ncbi:MAG TPA: hypothetical protein VFU72_11285, partial [Nitrolancea sp.]|nr:hypothetical protein [Nitrolancea sp.]
ARFYLHRPDANNDLELTLTPSALTLNQRVGGALHQIATASVPFLVHEAWYWVQVTQFPTQGTNAPYLIATLLYDTNGAIGSQIAQIAGSTFDAVTALSGVSGFGPDGAALVVGGVSSGAGVRTYLFGPGGWLTTSGGTGTIAFGWEQDTTKTATPGTLDSNGAVVVPVTSFGAARMDFPPAGTYDGAWVTYKGGAPSGTTAIPATVGQVFGLKALAKSSGLDATASTRFWVQEWDASGTQVATTDGIGAVSGNLASWTALHATYTVTNASCAYISVAVRSGSSNAGSAGATVWFDNVQCWNQTRTGQTTMSYHELRFPNNPCQLLLSGLQGDVAAPVALSLGLYISGTWAASSAIKLLLGRRQVAQAGAQLLGQAFIFSQQTGVLASTVYGGYYVSFANMSDWQPLCLSQRPADALGTYHLLGLAQSALSAGNLANLKVRTRIYQSLARWATAAGLPGDLSEYLAPYITQGAGGMTITAQNLWTLLDAGQAPIPSFAQGALNDPTGTYFTPTHEFTDTNVSHATTLVNWSALLPTDGALLTATLNNPTNSIAAPAAQWLWTYLDGLYQPFTATQGGQASPGWTYSVESGPTANASSGAGGPGTTGQGTINVNLAADPLLTVDPTVDVSGVSGARGVNQLVVVANDATGGNTWALHAELQYSPLYLFPR